MEEEEETGAIWIEASGGVEKVFGGVRLRVGGYRIPYLQPDAYDPHRRTQFVKSLIL